MCLRHLKMSTNDFTVGLENLLTSVAYEWIDAQSLGHLDVALSNNFSRTLWLNR